MKKICLLVSCYTLSLCSSALAYTTHPFYVAADAGFFRGDFNQTYNDQTANVAQNFSGVAQQQGYTEGLAFGYSKLINQQYLLGVELAGNLATHTSTYSASDQSFTDNLQIKHYLDLSFVPGFLLNDSTAVYAKLGLSEAYIKDQLTSPAGYEAVSTEYSSSKNTLGFVGGLGIKKLITDQFAIFAEGDYRDYGSMTFNSFQTIAATYTHSSTITAYNAVLGAAYHF